MGGTDFEIRAWAAAHDYELSDADDIPAELRAAFDASQAAQPDSADDWTPVEQGTRNGDTRSPQPTAASSAQATNTREEGPGAPPQGVDGFSIAALVLGIIPVLAGILGISFGAIGISRTKHGRRGRGMAVAGVVLGSLWLIGVVTAVAIAESHKASRDSTGAVATAGDVSSTDLRLGDCLASFDDGTFETVKLLPCMQPHGAEVYATFDLTGRGYPGESQVDRLSKGGCVARLAPAVGK